MISRAGLSYGIFFVIILTVVVAAGYFIFIRGDISADELEKRGEIIDQKKISNDLDFDGVEESILLTTYKSDQDYSHYIKVSDSGLKENEIKLNGFEEALSFCQQPVVELSKNQRAICLIGIVGVHSQNLQIAGYQEKVEIITFRMAEAQSGNMVSDAPNFGFEDKNNDQVMDIYIDNRDYDKDPTVDIIRSYYYFLDSQFVFENNQPMRLEEGLTTFEGQIN